MDENEKLNFLWEMLKTELGEEEACRQINAAMQTRIQQAAQDGEIIKISPDELKNSDYVKCRDCPNFVRDSSNSKMGRCDHMPGSLLSEDSGCLGGAAEMLVI